ncbi:hypothetical protein MKEN_01328200 [Mycena kentingensis (nom. inval.)]|nr:hypothetical protein MKEN_01328200 [Mycena kentingensis (nom. inval.)]
MQRTAIPTAAFLPNGDNLCFPRSELGNHPSGRRHRERNTCRRALSCRLRVALLTLPLLLPCSRHDSDFWLVLDCTMAGNMTESIIELSPPSAAFIAQRVDTLGPWVLGAYADCILLGVVFCQVRTFFVWRTRTPERTLFQRYCYWLVWVVLCLSVLKTLQEVTVVWVQNVHDFADPDVARLRVVRAWWQISTPLTTGVVGVTVQTFFCIRFFLLSRNWWLVAIIVAAMTLGITGICLTMVYIVADNVVLKVRWLLIHLIGVFIADFLITMGTFLALRQRAQGLERTTILIHHLMRIVFESAIPPTLIACVDLIMTQILGRAVYVISLLYTLNSINEYRRKHAASSNIDIITADGHTALAFGAPRTNVELAMNNLSLTQDIDLGSGDSKPSQSQVYIQTQVSTHVSPASTHAQESVYSQGRRGRRKPVVEIAKLESSDAGPQERKV